MSTRSLSRYFETCPLIFVCVYNILAVVCYYIYLCFCSFISSSQTSVVFPFNSTHLATHYVMYLFSSSDSSTFLPFTFPVHFFSPSLTPPSLTYIISSLFSSFLIHRFSCLPPSLTTSFISSNPSLIPPLPHLPSLYHRIPSTLISSFHLQPSPVMSLTHSSFPSLTHLLVVWLHRSSSSWVWLPWWPPALTRCSTLTTTTSNTTKTSTTTTPSQALTCE